MVDVEGRIRKILNRSWAWEHKPKSFCSFMLGEEKRIQIYQLETACCTIVSFYIPTSHMLLMAWIWVLFCGNYTDSGSPPVFYRNFSSLDLMQDLSTFWLLERTVCLFICLIQLPSLNRITEWGSMGVCLLCGFSGCSTQSSWQRGMEQHIF